MVYVSSIVGTKRDTGERMKRIGREGGRKVKCHVAPLADCY